MGGDYTFTGSSGGAFWALFIDKVDEFVSFAKAPFGGCDGLVAAETIFYRTGRDVQEQLLLHGGGAPRKFQTSTRIENGDVPSGCRQSSYLVFSSI